MVEVICEIGLNHNGNVELAKQLIDVAHDAGCDFVKFQKRCVELVYTDEELDTPRESPFGTTTREQKNGIEFMLLEYVEINKHCYEKVPWFSSPWDLQSLQFCAKAFDAPFIKIPSALITNLEFLEACKGYDQQVILSTGMSDFEIVDKAVDVLGKDKIYSIMHCTSTYPTKTEELNLNCIPLMIERYPWAKIGFSNHHPGIVFMAAAVAMGAKLIEFHITLDKLMYGSDQAASINPEGVRKVVKYIRDIEQALGDGVKRIYDSERPIIEKLRR